MPNAVVSRRALLSAGAGSTALLALSVAAAEPARAAWPVRRLGDRGEVVRALQEALGRAGYWCGTPDGHFGHLTQQAVWALQKVHDLTPDGVFGHRSLLALSRGTAPAPRHGHHRHIEIDLHRQILLATGPEGSTLTLNTSTGNGEPYLWRGRQVRAVTPTGAFEVYYTHSNGWQHGPLGSLYRPQFFKGDVAVHGSNSIPPYPDSHGCARLSVAAMDMLWQTGLMRMGTPVHVS